MTALPPIGAKIRHTIRHEDGTTVVTEGIAGTRIGNEFVTVGSIACVMQPGNTGYAGDRKYTVEWQILAAPPMDEPPDGTVLVVDQENRTVIWRRLDHFHPPANPVARWFRAGHEGARLPVTWDDFMAGLTGTVTQLAAIPACPEPIGGTSTPVWRWTDSDQDTLTIEASFSGAALVCTRPNNGSVLSTAACREAAAVLLHLADQRDGGMVSNG